MELINSKLEEIAHMIAGSLRVNPDAITEIKRHIIAESARFKKRAVDEKPHLYDSLTVTLTVKLEYKKHLVSGNEDLCLNPFLIPTCPYLKSDKVLPKPLQIKNFAYDAVYDNNWNIIQRRNPEVIKSLNESYFGTQQAYHTILDGHLYIFNNTMLKAVFLKFIPEDPRQLEEFNKENCVQCTYQNDMYIPEYLIPDIIDSVTNRLKAIDRDDYQLTADGK